MTPTAALTLDRTTVPLSESVRASIAVEGPAPLVVAAPKDLLAGASAEAWQVRPAGPATVEQLPGGRERWVQTYRLDPYVPGEAVPVAFAPFEVAAGGGPTVRLSVDARNVHVTTSLKQPKAADARPVTGVEELPQGSSESSVSAAAPFVLGALVLLWLVFRTWIRRRLQSPAITPADWARHELDVLGKRLAAGAVTPRRFAEQLAAAVRTFIQGRYNMPATRMTTAELAAAGSAPPGDVIPLLEQCDLVKFAGQELTVDECRELLERGRVVVAADDKPVTSPETQSGGRKPPEG